MADQDKNKTALIVGLILVVIFIGVVIWAFTATDDNDIFPPTEEEMEINNEEEEDDDFEIELPETDDNDDEI